MADDVRNQMGSEEGSDRELNRHLVTIFDDMWVEFDHAIERSVGEASLNIARTPSPDTSEPSTAAGVSSEPARTTQEGSGQSDTDSPLISVEIDMSLSRITELMGETERIEETEHVGETGQVEELRRISVREAWGTEEPVRTQPMLTPNTSLQILESFPAIATPDLPEGYQDCPICQESYESNEDSEVPVRLPCQHIFGRTCISKWLSENTCPLCRATIYRANVGNVLVPLGDAREPTPSVLQHIDQIEQESSTILEEGMRLLTQNVLSARVRQLEALEPARTATSLHIAQLESVMRDLESLNMERHDG